LIALGLASRAAPQVQLDSKRFGLRELAIEISRKLP
jgi:hypothetical protein